MYTEKLRICSYINRLVRDQACKQASHLLSLGMWLPVVDAPKTNAPCVHGVYVYAVKMWCELDFKSSSQWKRNCPVYQLIRFWLKDGSIMFGALDPSFFSYLFPCSIRWHFTNFLKFSNCVSSYGIIRKRICKKYFDLFTRVCVYVLQHFPVLHPSWKIKLSTLVPTSLYIVSHAFMLSSMSSPLSSPLALHQYWLKPRATTTSGYIKKHKHNKHKLHAIKQPKFTGCFPLYCADCIARNSITIKNGVFLVALVLIVASFLVRKNITKIKTEPHNQWLDVLCIQTRTHIYMYIYISAKHIHNISFHFLMFFGMIWWWWN